MLENKTQICPTLEAYQVKHHKNTFVCFETTVHKYQLPKESKTTANFSLS